MRRISVSLTALAVLAGCGGTDDERAPSAALRAFFEAAISGDGKEACALASERYARQLEYDNPSCEAFFSSGAAFGGTDQVPEIVHVDERGEAALVTARLGGRYKPEARVCLVTEEGEWKVDAIGISRAPKACR